MVCYELFPCLGENHLLSFTLFGNVRIFPYLYCLLHASNIIIADCSSGPKRFFMSLHRQNGPLKWHLLSNLTDFVSLVAMPRPVND